MLSVPILLIFIAIITIVVILLIKNKSCSNYSINGKCVDACPVDTYIDGKKCVESCPVYTYIDGKKCVSSIPKGKYADGKNLVDSCYPLNKIPDETNRCVSSCSKYVIITPEPGLKCISNCNSYNVTDRFNRFKLASAANLCMDNYPLDDIYIRNIQLTDNADTYMFDVSSNSTQYLQGKSNTPNEYTSIGNYLQNLQDFKTLKISNTGLRYAAVSLTEFRLFTEDIFLNEILYSTYIYPLPDEYYNDYIIDSFQFINDYSMFILLKSITSSTIIAFHVIILPNKQVKYIQLEERNYTSQKISYSKCMSLSNNIYTYSVMATSDNTGSPITITSVIEYTINDENNLVTGVIYGKTESVYYPYLSNNTLSRDKRAFTYKVNEDDKFYNIRISYYNKNTQTLALETSNEIVRDNVISNVVSSGNTETSKIYYVKFLEGTLALHYDSNIASNIGIGTGYTEDARVELACTDVGDKVLISIEDKNRPQGHRKQLLLYDTLVNQIETLFSVAN